MAAKWATTLGLGSLTAGVEAQVSAGGGAVTINTTGGRAGQGALKILNMTSGQRSGIAHPWFTSGAPGENFHRFYLIVTTAPNVRTTIFDLHDTATLSSDSTWDVSIELDTDRTLRLMSLGGVLEGTSAALTLGTRYRIEVRYDGSGGGGTNVTVGRIDGSDFASETAGTLTGTCDVVRLGGNLHGETCTTGQWEISDYVAYDATGSTQNTWPGDGALAYLWPNDAGDFAEGSAGGSSPAATGWQSVDEHPPNDGTDFWVLADPSTGATDADRLDVSVGAFPAGTPASVSWVAVGYRAHPATNAACSIAPRIKSQASGTLAEGSTTSITGTAWVTHDDTVATAQYKLIRTTDPQSGAAWGTDPSGWQIGVRAPDATPDVEVTLLWALMEHVPGAAAVPAYPLRAGSAGQNARLRR